MVDVDKKQLTDILASVIEACDSIDENSTAEYRSNILADCQEAVISVGENLESRKNALDQQEIVGKAIVSKLEKICEFFFLLSNEYNTENKQEILSALEEVQGQIISMPKTYRVVFLPYKAAMWDCFDSVWRAFKDDVRCEVDVVPIPYFDQDRTIGQMVPRYEGAKLPDYVNPQYFGEYSLEEMKPDIAFVHNPFDGYNLVTQVHSDYFSEELKKHCAKLVYIPYYVNGGYLSQHYIDLPLMYRADAIILQSEQMKSYCKNVPFYDRILALGSPKFDQVIRLVKEGAQPPSAWGVLPDDKLKLMLNTTIDELLSDSDVMWEKLEQFFEKVSRRDDVLIIWRPHPLLEATIKAMRPQYLERYNKLVSFFNENNVGVFDDTPDSALAVASCDAYIGSNYSAIIASFMAIDRPCLGFDSTRIFDYEGRDKTDRLSVDEAFVTPNGPTFFLAYENEKYQFEDFIDDIKNNNMSPFIDKNKKEFARISANMDGTCGQAIHDFLMPQKKSLCRIDFPADFFEAEEREKFYVSSMMKKAWAAQMEMLEYIRDICSRHDIQWFADFGTMLGAIRHKGFVPWDDDIDISMTRENLDRFIEACQTELVDEYRLLCTERESEYDSVIVRLMNASTISTDERRMEMFHGCPYCVGIDITAMDYVPEDETERTEYHELIKYLWNQCVEVRGKRLSNKEKKSIIAQIENRTGGKLLRDRELHCAIMYMIDQLSHRYTREDTELVTGMWRFNYNKNYLFKRELYDEIIEVPFENITVPVPKAYDEILTIQYGEKYMNPVRYESHDYPFYKAQEEILTKALGYIPL